MKRAREDASVTFRGDKRAARMVARNTYGDAAVCASSLAEVELPPEATVHLARCNSAEEASSSCTHDPAADPRQLAGGEAGADSNSGSNCWQPAKPSARRACHPCTAAAQPCHSCSRVFDLETQLKEQQAFIQQLHAKNCLLTLINSNLVMRLSALSRTMAGPLQPPPPVDSAQSLHLRISLPGTAGAAEVASGNSCQPGSLADSMPASPAAAQPQPCDDRALTTPMLHIWVNTNMPVGAIRQSMRQFVKSPPEQAWLLCAPQTGAVIDDNETPRTLGLMDNDMLCAQLEPCTAAASGSHVLNNTACASQVAPFCPAHLMP